VDHGLEDPDERVAKGKPLAERLLLRQRMPEGCMDICKG